MTMRIGQGIYTASSTPVEAVLQEGLALAFEILQRAKLLNSDNRAAVIAHQNPEDLAQVLIKSKSA